MTAIQDGVANLLAVLPAPIPPAPFAKVDAKSTLFATGADTGTATSLPDATLVAPNVITLKTSGTTENLAAPTGLGGQESSGADDASPQATPAVADPAPTPKLRTNVLRPGNKVKPGQKFTGVTGDGADEAVDAVDATPSTTTADGPVDTPKDQSTDAGTNTATDPAPSSDDPAGAAA